MTKTEIFLFHQKGFQLVMNNNSVTPHSYTTQLHHTVTPHSYTTQSHSVSVHFVRGLILDYSFTYTPVQQNEHWIVELTPVLANTLYLSGENGTKLTVSV